MTFRRSFSIETTNSLHDRSSTYHDSAHADVRAPHGLGTPRPRGGSVLASVLGGLAVGGRVVSYGAAAGEPDPAPPPVPDLRTQNLTLTGFSILNRARKAPPKALSLIQGVLTLTHDGLHIPAPAVVDWAEAIDAHIAQSEGRSRGKTVVRL